MRPVRLELQGFTCYREKQEIDFSHLGLFAIAGPTGSGKSSLLDAITFALYGKVPRLGSQNLDEFISLGASRASVVLDFDMQGERFRVVRSMPRSGAKRAQIEQITDGAQRALCDGVGDVNEKVRALLGLDYEAFIQSVLLPQGDFAKFLKSNPKDQQKILRDLLRLGVYEKMRERAGNEARELSSLIDTARALLEGPYAQATASNLKLIEAELAEVHKNKDAATAELGNCRKTLQTIQGHWALVEERQGRSKSLEALHRERAKIDELKKSIARANQAKSVVPALDAVVSKTRALKDMETEGRDLEEKLKATQDDAKTRSGDLHGAEQEALGLAPKRERIVKLATIVPVLEEHRSWTSRRNEASTNLAKSEKVMANAKDRVSKAQVSLETIQRQREQLVQQQSGSGYDVTAHTILKRAQRPAYELAQARESEKNLVEPLEMARKLQQQAMEAFEAKTSAHKATEERHSDSLKAAQAAAANYAEAQNQEKAATLRLTLHSGCRCPVCEQPIKEVPATSMPSDLQRTEKAVKRAETERTLAASRRDAAHGDMIQARSGVENALVRVGEYEAQSIKAKRRVEENTTAVTAALAPLECPAGILLEHFVEQEFAAFERLSKDFRDLADKTAKVDLAHQRAESDLAGAKQSFTACRETAERLSNEITEAKRQIVEYERRMAAVDSADPAKEIETLRAEINTLEQRLQHLKALNQEAQAEAQTAERKCGELNIRLANLAGDREQAEHAATNALSGAGFLDGMEARAAMLPQTAITAGEARLAKFEDDVKQLSMRLAELDALLNGVRISKVDVEAAARTVRDKEVVSQGFDHRFGELSGLIKKLRIDTEKAELLRVEHGNRLARSGIVQQLARDLKSDAFQQYLLEGSFRRLVSGASSRLRQLDDRYELVFVDSKFAVIDHDHGSQTRLADTLSGGETFLVSLALALELSEQVQQAAGAVRLDSLFIDEGFGTLDPETLDTVAEAIESLGRTNRMVGVITHVAELHRRLPRLEVRPSASGSIVEYAEE